MLMVANIRYRSTTTSFLHALFRVVPRQYYSASSLRVCVDHASSCRVMYTSRGSTRVEVTRVEVTRVEVLLHAWKVHAWNKTCTHALTRKNLLSVG